MAEQTGIEWCDSTFNPWIGCTKVSPACDHCYAAVSTPARALGVAWGAGEPRRRTSVANWQLPLRWDAQHEAFFAEHGRRRRVFCSSLADVFDNAVDPGWRQDLFDLIACTPSLDWLLLTKRIGNAARMIDEARAGLYKLGEPGAWPWHNVWLGATICNQDEADRDIPKLLATPARVRFVSMEPLLGHVDLRDIDIGADRDIPREFWTDVDDDGSPPAIGLDALTGLRWQRFGDWDQRGPGIDWVIAGGESGPHARPMHPDWARSLRDQCAGAEVPFLFKQWGEWAPHQARAGGDERGDLQAGRVRYLTGDGREPDGHFRRGDAAVARIGKKLAGRALDGFAHDGAPA